MKHLISTFLTPTGAVNLPAVLLVLTGIGSLIGVGPWAFLGACVLNGILASLDENQRQRDMKTLDAISRLERLEKLTSDLDRLRTDISRITNRPGPR